MISEEEYIFTEEDHKRIRQAMELLKYERSLKSKEELEATRKARQLLEKYNEMFDDGIPFQLPFDEEDLIKAIETNTPFSKWDKFKGWYRDEPVPEDIYL